MIGWLERWWRRPALKIRDPENSSARRADTFSGRAVGADGAMQLAAFWACVRLIAETVATLPIGVFERADDGGKKPRSDHPLYGLLHDSPNADQTAAEFWEGQIASLCIFGNSYSLKEKRGNGEVIALEPLSPDPSEMTVTRGTDGGLRYSFVHRGRRYDKLTEDDVFHIRGFGMGDVGLSPLSYARQTLALYEATEASAGAQFRSGMKPTVFFSVPTGVKLNADNRKDFKQLYIDPYVGSSPEAMAGLLEFGIEPKVVSIPAKDAELLLSRRYSVEDTCRWLRVPPILIGHSQEGQTMWGTGISEILGGWKTLGLSPYLTRVQQAARKRLMTAADRGRGLFVEYNPDGLLWTDAAKRAEMYSKLSAVAGITPNQICDKENFPRFEGGDVRLVNSTMVPLALAGQRPSRVQPAPGEPIPE